MLSIYQEFGDIPLQLDRAFWKKSVGGKAFFLSQLYQAGIPVPAGIILRSCPDTAAAWLEVVEWWKREGRPVAVRSSAADEDSDDLSFAGQYKTFLNISTEDTLTDAVTRCFASIGAHNDTAYRERLQNSTPADGNCVPAMNVVVQRMIDPLSAGVYFTTDPTRPETGWLIEWVDGLGDSLVSGAKTPRRVHRENAADSAIAHVLLPVIERIERLLQFPVDVEWAIDREGRPWILQARPITAQSSSSDQRSRVTTREIARLSKRNRSAVSWDGHAFAEWSGIPSELSFSIWQRAFASRGALGSALRSVGYLGSGSSRRGSVLERVLGRPYVNQRRMDDLLFGASLFVTDAHPRPHVRIDRDRLTASTLLRAPMAAFYMARAGWRSSGSSQSLLRACRDAYAHESQIRLPNDPSMYHSEDLPSLLSRFEGAANDFADRLLHWPMVLILLVEGSTERLRHLLTNSVPPDQVEALLQRTLGHAVNSVTLEMDRQYHIACYNPAARAHYLSQYGHRAVGELDLARPRWIERGDRAFVAPRQASIPLRSAAVCRPSSDGPDDLNLITGFYRPLYVKEAARLREMLSLRESWKHVLMRPYAHLRWMAAEIGRRTGLNDCVFDLRVAELRRAAHGPSAVPRLRRLAELRFDRRQSLSDVHLPMLVTLDALRALDSGVAPDSGASSRLLHGQALSPGLVCGEVRVVRNPEDVSTADWPEDTILVAEATDPGWTALFLRVKGLVIERGGVLSHCAIVAREMRLPAVSGVLNCCEHLRDGQKIWVDGNRGHVQLA
jgi:phosphohistidine swiveling domain-containing protein